VGAKSVSVCADKRQLNEAAGQNAVRNTLRSACPAVVGGGRYDRAAHDGAERSA